MKPLEGRKRRFGDRKDGFRVRNLDPMGRLEPYIMRTRSDAWVLFEDKIDITHTQDFLHEMRRGPIPGLTLYHIVFAAIARAYSQIPQLNRFIAGNRLYARNEIKACMTILKEMNRNSESSVIMPRFELEGTLPEAVAEIERLTNPIKKGDEGDDFDAMAKVFDYLPGFLLDFVFRILNWLDKRGWVPKFLLDLSPFHTSFYLTNMGSIGMDPVFHHIYNFGTTSVFGAIGSKEAVYELDRHGQPQRKVYLNLKFVVDERICNGFIFALGFKQIKSYISKPEQLMEPPKTVYHDKIDRE